jgi:ubiquinone/menaquinone biosynthesis C-methylase UbiE
VILDSLQIHEGDTVVDLGSGAGYFALKLAPRVGKSGRVLASDLRRLSLFFLALRAFLQGNRNIQTIVATPTDPRVPDDAAEAVLICNTYHEFADPPAILRQIRQSLKPGRRLVVTDRSPSAGDPPTGVHHVAPAAVVSELQQSGFDVIFRSDNLLTDPDGDSWWLLVASKRSSF